MNQELRELIEAQCDGTATAVQRDRLQQRMDEDPRAVRAYVEYLDLHAQLQWQSRGVQALPGAFADDETEIAPMPARKFRAVVSFFSRQTPLSLTVATLVIMLLVTSMAFMAPPFYRAMTAKNDVQEPAPPRVVAEITSLHNAVWVHRQMDVELGATLHSGQLLELNEGHAEITFGNGTVVLLQGPAKFRPMQADASRLLSGNLTAKMPAATGESGEARFRVDTAIAPIVDLGTEFGVSVRGSRMLDVHVFEGQVAVEPSQFVRQRQVLNAGDALHVDTITNSVSKAAAKPANFTLITDLKAPARWRRHTATLRKDPDLVAYYLFDREQNNTNRVRNFGTAGKSLDGTNHGARPAEGRWSDKPALYFGGPESGHFVDLGAASSERLNLSGSFSVAVWFRAKPVKNSWATIIAKGDTAWRLHFYTEGQTLSFAAHKHPQQVTELECEGDLADGLWHLATIVHEARENEFRKLIYVDGQLAGTQVLTVPMASNDYPVYLGDNAERSGRNFHGWIDEVAIYTRALTPAEIITFYQAGNPATTFEADEAN